MSTSFESVAHFVTHSVTYVKPSQVHTVSLALSVCLAFSCSVTTLAGAAEQPNIVLILVDDLGYGDLSSYGAQDLRTPHIDSLMKAGMRLDHFYANCCVCSPTRAALMTGRFPDLVGVPGVVRTHDRSNWGYLAPDAVLLPQILKKAGYHTALVGKWHLGLTSPNLPNQRGFDHFHGFLGDMMDDYYAHRRHGNNYMRLNQEVIDPKGHASDLFTEWSIEYIRQRAAARQPFFLYLAYNAPHTPIQPPKDWLDKVKQREPQISNQRAALVALIEHMDDGIGKVVQALRDTGIAEHTLVIFSSDNGGQLHVEANNGPLRSGKTHLYEGGIKVAACAVWPGRIKAGTRNDIRALTMDLFPTVAAAASADAKHKIDGRSILPTLLGQRQTLADRDEVFMWLQAGRKDALRRGDWKLVGDVPGKPYELFDLKVDPGEERDVAKAEAGRFEELKQALEAHNRQASAVNWKRPSQRSEP